MTSPNCLVDEKYKSFEGRRFPFIGIEKGKKDWMGSSWHDVGLICKVLGGKVGLSLAAGGCISEAFLALVGS
jgi:hypothetical protein